MMRLAWVVICFAISTAPVSAAPSPPPNPEIVYVEPGTVNKIVVMNADGSNKTTVYSGARFQILSEPVLSPDAGWIAFTSPTSGLVLLDRITRATTVLLTNADCVEFCSNPRFSPSGARIAVIGGGNSSPRVLAVPSPTGGAAQVLYTGSPGTPFWDVAWDSDETQIAVSENVGGSPDHILVVILLTQTPRTIVAGPFPLIPIIDWARNGVDRIVFDTGVTDSPDRTIYTVDVTDTGASAPVLVTSGMHPSFSPDNGSIVYRKNGSPGRIARRNLTTGATTNLATGLSPEWKRSPTTPRAAESAEASCRARTEGRDETAVGTHNRGGDNLDAAADPDWPRIWPIGRELLRRLLEEPYGTLAVPLHHNRDEY